MSGMDVQEASLRFWGVRGSFPSASKAHQLLGGHTACISLQCGADWLVIDAGSGLRDFADFFADQSISGRLTILVSHCHWDHILGFPYLTKRLGPKLNVEVVSLRRHGCRVEDSLRWQQQSGRSCLDWDDIEGNVNFREIEEAQPTEFSGFKVTAYQLNHPGVSSGFRVEVGGQTLAYVSDLAPVQEALLADSNGHDLSQSEFRQRLWENEHHLTSRADAVVYDTFFRESDWKTRVHWGHSAPSHAIANCVRSQATRLFLFHHSGEYSDQDQVEMLTQLNSGSPQGLTIELARQGLVHRDWSSRSGSVIT